MFGVTSHMIKYLGSKRKLIPHILSAVQDVTPPGGSVVDLFSGTSRVGYALKGAGYGVHSNDHNAFAHTLGLCYVAAHKEDILSDAQKLIAEFNSLAGSPGYFTEMFCQESRYIQPHNGERIDAIRSAIEGKSLDPILKAVVIVSLMEGADRVDSTVGLQMAYLKSWAKRSYKPLELRVPNLLSAVPGCEYKVTKLDAEVCSGVVSCDTLYLDPPYNQHSYLGNYHVWESLVLWDKPETYGIAKKRVDCQTRKSSFNFKRRALDALRKVLTESTFNAAILSYSDEGHIGLDDMMSLLSEFGEVERQQIGYRRHIGHKLGKHNSEGVRVSGDDGASTNKECLFTLRRSL